MFDVLGLGVCSVDDILYVDHFPGANGKARVQSKLRQCGGLTANALVAAQRLGASTAFAGQLGRDELSEYVLANFAQQGVHTAHVLREDAAQPVHSTIVVSGGGADRAIFPYRPGPYGAPDSWPAPEVIRNTRVLFVDHMGAKGQARAARIAREAGIPVVSDLERDESSHFGELNALVDHAIFSHEFARHLAKTDDPERAVLKLCTGRAVTVVTCGERGCFVVDGAATDDAFNVSAFAVDVVDTTGCGDVFHGAYCFALARGLPLMERLRLAAAAAALKATQRGGQAGCPTLPRVEALLNPKVQ